MCTFASIVQEWIQEYVCVCVNDTATNNNKQHTNTQTNKQIQCEYSNDFIRQW
jgi:hypothetical protein